MSQNNELYHYGVLGMKWGVHKAKKNADKAKTARTSAREWDEIAKNAQAKGKSAVEGVLYNTGNLLTNGILSVVEPRLDK